MTVTLARAADWYAASRKWPVFPLRPRDKRPLTAHGLLDATTDTATIKTWWDANPDANVGVVMGEPSGIFAIDIDGEGGAETLVALERKYGPLPLTVEQATARGRHLLFKLPAGVEIRNSAGKIGLGIDVRGTGGYIAVAPSVHPSGAVYEWKAGRKPNEIEPADPSSWLVDLIVKPEPQPRPTNGAGAAPGARMPNYAAAALAGELAAVAAAPEGQRNDQLNRSAFSLGTLVGAGMIDRGPVERSLAGAAAAAGLDAREAIATIKSGIDAGIQHPREIPEQSGPAHHTNSTATGSGDALTRAAARLAKLSRLDYERARESEADALGVRVTTLDAAVAEVRREGDDNRQQGRKLDLATPEPAPDPVDGTALLDALADAAMRYVALPEHGETVVALWAVHTHVVEGSSITPRLTLVSPVKRCGKSTLLRVLDRLVATPLPTENITSAALFRTIEKARPTLLVDEADSFAKNSDELRGIINSGHHRAGQVIRTVGDDHEPRCFSTWAPVAIACIGRLPDTIEDRSIIIPLRRRRRDEKIQRFLHHRGGELRLLGRQAARWAADNLTALADADPDVPAALHDRAADNWRPLLAIADLAGGDWPVRARTAALALSVRDGDDAAGTELLADIEKIFAETGADRITSADLVKRLTAIEDHRWCEWRNGKPMTMPQLARQLAPYGIAPSTIRVGETTPKGYMRAVFVDAFARYLPSDPQHRHNPQDSADFRGFRSATDTPDVADGKCPKPAETATCGGVADEKGESGEEVGQWAG